MKNIKKVILLLAFLFLAISGCKNHNTPELPETEHEPFIEEGFLDQGAKYTIILPYDWVYSTEYEKKLIIYCHGYAAPGEEFSDSSEYEIVKNMSQSFIDDGYAVAFSHFAESGWAIGDGSLSSKELQVYFNEQYGFPDFTYLFGISEGALITIKLIEESPELFDGALSFAGPLDGTKSEIEYIVNSRIAFDHFFKDSLKSKANGVDSPKAVSLAGALGYDLDGTDDVSVLDAKPDPNHLEYYNTSAFIDDMYYLVRDLLIDEPDKTLKMASVKVNDNYLFPYDYWSTNLVPVSDPEFESEFAYIIATVLWYNIFGTEDLITKSGGIPADTDGYIYTYADSGTSVVFDVERFVSDPATHQFLEDFYTPVGNLTKPVVILHIERDPAVPYFHAVEYEKKAAASADMLTLISITGFGHGFLMDFLGFMPFVDLNITMDQINDAFEILVTKVEG